MRKIFFILMLLIFWLSAIQPAICQKSKKAKRTTKKPAATSVEKSKQEETKKTEVAQPETSGQKEVKKTNEQKESNKVDEPPIQNIKQVANISAKITRSSFKSGNATSPSWQVSITIKNLTNKQLELGESLVVLETARVLPFYAGNYVLRSLEKPTNHLIDFQERYQLDWGYTKSRDGSSIVVLPTSNPQDLVFSITFNSGSAKPETLESGYGEIKPQSERTITAEIPTPIGLKNSTLRNQIIVILPRMRVLGNTTLPMSHTILHYNVGDTEMVPI